MIHEKFPQFFPENDKTSRFKKAAVQRANHIICISENSAPDLIELLGVTRDRTSVVHLAHTVHRRTEGPTNRVADRPYIAYVGARDGYKNFAGLVRAFGRSEFLRNSLSIVVSVRPLYTGRTRGNESGASLLQDRIVQIQGNDELLESVYRGAAAFVCPSLYEGFGLPPLEAMSVDCPLSASQTSSLPEICGEAAEYFDPHEPRPSRSQLNAP